MWKPTSPASGNEPFFFLFPPCHHQVCTVLCIEYPGLLSERACSWSLASEPSTSPSVVFFPSAHRVRRSSPEFLDPVLQKSVPEVELLYEFLSTGVQIDPDSRLTLRDPELSSMRKAATFDVLCNDVIPKAISDIRRLGDQLSRVPGPLKKEDFERTALTMAYTALKTSKLENENQRRVWMETLTKLFVALRRDLMALYQKDGRQ